MPRSDDPFPRDLGAFFKAAASTLDDVKEQVLRGGQAGKATLDVQLLKRQRDKALQKLGEVLLDEVTRGAPLPVSCDAVVAELKELDGQIERAKSEAERLWSSDGSPARSTGTPTARRGDDDDDDDHA
ncbi:MAG: hypothetical protein FJ137_12520 [Deltaproteobacteria bacterium]|nr:hypothetical protein [Deltaproteobacteria bacterium]